MTDNNDRTARDYVAAMTDAEAANWFAQTRTTGPSQITRADLGSMRPDQIETARKAGRLDNLLKGGN